MERKELSKKNPYYISKERTYELKHFCRQYNEWKRHLASLTHIIAIQNDRVHDGPGYGTDPVESLVEERDKYLRKMEAVEDAAIAADPALSRYILLGVTEGISYDKIRARMDIPCNRDMYYAYYHKFFWLLDRSQK